MIQQTKSWKLLILLFIIAVSCTEDDQSGQLRNETDVSGNERLSMNEPDSVAPIVSDVNGRPKPSSETSSLITFFKNHAINATPTAQTTFVNYVGGELHAYDVNNINDGDTNTTLGPDYSWANETSQKGGALPQTVDLTLPVAKTINTIKIFSSNGFEIQDFTVQVIPLINPNPLNDPWTTLYSVQGNTSVVISRTFENIAVTAVRIICQKGPAIQPGFARLNEVQIFGTEKTIP